MSFVMSSAGMLQTVVATLASAVRFLTIVPVPGASGGFGAAAFPVIGLAVGLSVAVADAILEFVPFELRNIGVVVFLALLTGGIHYDGLADTFDGLGGADREERMRLMREGTIGTFGVLALMLALATKISALTLLGPPTRLPALVLAPMLGRLAMVVTAWQAPAARSEGLGAAFCAALTARDLRIAGGSALVLAIAIGGADGLLGIFFAIGVSLGIRALATRGFGGVTGDVLGAAGEIVETLLLAFFAMTRLGA